RVALVVMKTSYHDGVPLRPHVIVRVQDASGRIGYGVASPLPGFTGEAAESILVQLHTHLLPLVIGLDAFHINRECTASLPFCRAIAARKRPSTWRSTILPPKLQI